MNLKIIIPFFLLILAVAAFSNDKIQVVTTTTDLAWAAQEIGKDLVDVHSLLNGTENPHFVDTLPEFIRLVGEAQVVCIVGMDLEVGWIPKVLSRSGNALVQPGGTGYCEVGKGIQVLEHPAGPVDRSMGDVHPAGNPHFWLNPKALADGSAQIKDALIRVDTAHATSYTKNYEILVKKLQELQQKNRARLAPLLSKLSGPVVIEYHKEFTYFYDAYGIRSLGSIEEKPGVPPSAGRIAQIGLAAKSEGVKVAMGGEYVPKKTMERFTEISGIPVLKVPTSIQPKGKIKDYVELQNELINAFAKALAGKEK